jgi:hypothetical protein
MKVIQAFSSLLPNAFKPAYNRYWIIVKKGAFPASGLVYVPNVIRIPFDVAAGTDSYNPAEVRAMVSLAVGVMNQLSSGIGDTLCTGVM